MWEMRVNMPAAAVLEAIRLRIRSIISADDVGCDIRILVSQHPCPLQWRSSLPALSYSACGAGKKLSFKAKAASSGFSVDDLAKAKEFYTETPGRLLKND